LQNQTNAADVDTRLWQECRNAGLVLEKAGWPMTCGNSGVYCYERRVFEQWRLGSKMTFVVQPLVRGCSGCDVGSVAIVQIAVPVRRSLDIFA
jgi:hypothetical protein